MDKTDPLANVGKIFNKMLNLPQKMQVGKEKRSTPVSGSIVPEDFLPSAPSGSTNFSAWSLASMGDPATSTPAQHTEWLTGNYYLRVVVREAHSLAADESDTTNP